MVDSGDENSARNAEAQWLAEGMRLVVFDQHARRLSGWHYEKLKAVGGE